MKSSLAFEKEEITRECPLLSLVVPCYNEEKALPCFIKEVQRVMPQIGKVDVEVILVNDGSKDNTLGVMQQISSEFEFVRYVSFSRNFGKESAILAGLKEADGDWVAVMDADLQDPPSMLPEMLRIVCEEGYDCVGTRRISRKGEPPIRSFFARCFYKIINKIADVKLVDGARDFKLLSREAVDALVALPEVNRFSKGLYEWIGFRTKWLEFENVERVAGETKWSFWGLVKYSIEGILSFSTAPLVLSVILGLTFMFLALGGIAVLVARQLIYHNSAYGWTSMVCIILLLSGVQLFCLGIIGQYISKMYTEIKKRPHYIISERSR
ncbi:MAG: glycosyltransferase family 2 protein [Akkermansia sp.]|nr:glycosyltransferase family 2 protein [Akkermansia sp.]